MKWPFIYERFLCCSRESTRIQRRLLRRRQAVFNQSHISISHLVFGGFPYLRSQQTGLKHERVWLTDRLQTAISFFFGQREKSYQRPVGHPCTFQVPIPPRPVTSIIHLLFVCILIGHMGLLVQNGEATLSEILASFHLSRLPRLRPIMGSENLILS